MKCSWNKMNGILKTDDVSPQIDHLQLGVNKKYYSIEKTTKEQIHNNCM